MAPKIKSRWRVTLDDDGGVTATSPTRQIVVSLIEREGIVYVEPYPYETGKVISMETLLPANRKPVYALTVTEEINR